MTSTRTPNATQTAQAVAAQTAQAVATARVIATRTAIAQVTATFEARQTQTAIVVASYTPTPIVYGKAMCQPTPKSGPVTVYSGTVAKPVDSITIDSLVAVGTPIAILEGSAVVRYVRIDQCPAVLDMGGIMVKNLKVDYKTNTGTSTTVLQ